MLIVTTWSGATCSVSSLSWTAVTATTTSTGWTTFSWTPRTLEFLPRLKKGDNVRVTDGLLHGRSGVVQGLLAVRHRWLAFVEWPEGGCATFREDHLETVPDDIVEPVSG